MPHLRELDCTSQGQPLGNPRSLLQDSALESPPLFPVRVLGMEAFWQRNTVDWTVLRQQHLFVLEAGDPRGVCCKSEKHSGYDSPFTCVLICTLFICIFDHINTHKQWWTIAFFPSSAICVSSTVSHTQICCIPGSPSHTTDSRIFISALKKKEKSLWSYLLLAVPRQSEGQHGAAQPASCAQRQGEREASQTLGLPWWPCKASPPVPSTRSGVTGIWLV